MSKWILLAIAAYFAFQIAVVAVIIMVSRKSDKRYKPGGAVSVPDGYEPTEEVYIDPVSGVKTRVYYHPKTGDRQYIVIKQDKD